MHNGSTVDKIISSFIAGFQEMKQQKKHLQAITQVGIHIYIYSDLHVTNILLWVAFLI